VLKKVSILFVLKLVKIPLTLLLLSLTARYYGISLEKDIWLLVYTTVLVLDGALWGPINETYRAKFVMIKEKEGEKIAIGQTQSLLFFLTFFSLILVAIMYLIPDFFAKFLAPQYQGKDLQTLIQMIYWVAPVLIFNQLTQIGLSILNGYEIFYVAEISSFISIIINILFLYFLHNIFGINALPISYYVSAVALLFFIIYFVKKSNIALFTTSWRFDFNGFKTYFLFSAPFFIPYFIAQINYLVEKVLAGKLGNGTISTLDFAFKIPNMMYTILISVIMSVLVPVLSKNFANNKEMDFNSEFKSLFRIGVLVICSIVTLLLGCGDSIAKILYDKGNITMDNLILISDLSILYGFSLFGVFSYLMFGMSLLSSEQSKYYAFMGLLCQGGIILTNIIFYRILGIYTFPLSIFLSNFIFAFLMSKRYPFLTSLQLGARKYIIYSIFCIIIIFFMKKIIIIHGLYTSLLVFGMISLAIMIIGINLFKIEEKVILEQFLKKSLIKFKRR